MFSFLDRLKELGGTRFRCDEDVKSAVHQWLRAQPETCYYDGIKELVGRWEKQGDHVENGCILLLLSSFK
jgi:hypothetical protein